MTEGGDKRTPRAKVDIAKREQQIVALKLRGVPVNDISRVIGLSRRAVSAAFNKALRRNTDQDLQAHHLSENAKLDMEEANIWRIMDANKDDWKVQISCTAQLRGIHIRRAKLLGLDAPTKLDLSGFDRRDENQQSAESLARQRVFEAMTDEEQEAIYEKFEEARRRVAGAIETTATVISGNADRESYGGDSETDDEA
jgi:hypothetical protein